MTPERKKQIIERAEGRVADFKRMRKAGLHCKHGDFYPSVHYPPITLYPEITEEELFAGYTNPPDGLFDIYAHIPFCERRCIFCHYPLQLGKGKEKEKDRYLAALEKEMDIYMARLGLDKIKARSILIGGGTPTFLTLEQNERFLKFFTKRVDLSECTQFNYDLDPNSIIGPEGRERLRLMRDYGVDRLTIGVQSLDEGILKKMNRTHGVQDAIESIQNSKEFGYQLDIEFIFGHPGQTLDNWIDLMEQAVTLGSDEIQLYRLKVEAHGDYQAPLKGRIQRDYEKRPSVEETMMMKQIAIDILEDNGYPYENIRRVFSKSPELYSHYTYNQCCMLYDEIGFGLSTFSSLRDRFALTTQYFDEYYAKIEAGKLPINRGLVRDTNEQVRWAIALPIKNRDIHKGAFKDITGVPFDQAFPGEFQKLKDFGLVTEDENIVKVTKLGAFFADEVAEHFYSPKYMPFPIEDYEPGPLSPMHTAAPCVPVGH
uniref:Oxygen-independent coproporphyrinogen-3 oxidase n=1 Tax=Candidatus Kentrum sp. FM TaxID=2126340 RepID=A0A450W3U7_9GAMM|nr:MAG: oxygen-independent coproporphyrinogen-3 oxidase [Candidatus Kentron sp. FM]VFJ66662.1 MAG: oxygen-independent coproporphyrinogen-3 oxidase [Candidatus Kentron sp. FM]VFK11703.1 MAG: oxygen-independent coproporphyrinogen-3 oxidase [Candidatus Kentron sp. FM]